MCVLGHTVAFIHLCVLRCIVVLPRLPMYHFLPSPPASFPVFVSRSSLVYFLFLSAVNIMPYHSIPKHLSRFAGARCHSQAAKQKDGYHNRPG
ncbi:hypothetical protein BJ322DRAFT_1069412 [Thelephora terrestris]|uniref:Uncharacterized protein n=1 Tax=Thelephora terrestris TaxID=56493 RepID=A0A9P6HB80_9AGAM|nr:hypothetical protein BJ322DRAFT_1069412 [Thelephora terrestris]